MFKNVYRLKKQYEASKVGYVGTIDPFDKEFVTTGIEQSARMNFPIKFNVQADTHDQVTGNQRSTFCLLKLTIFFFLLWKLEREGPL